MSLRLRRNRARRADASRRQLHADSESRLHTEKSHKSMQFTVAVPHSSMIGRDICAGLRNYPATVALLYGSIEKSMTKNYSVKSYSDLYK